MKIIYQPHVYAQQRQREKKRWIWPVHLAMEATQMRDLGHDVRWDEVANHGDQVRTEPEGLDFMLLPAPDREFTDAFNPKYQANGNYKHNPGTYIQSAAGCWWGKCKFCKEKGMKYEVRPVDDVINEIIECKELGFREIFDDAASLAMGPWREEFIEKLEPLKIAFSCNMRFAATPSEQYRKMKKAGFRMLLYGLESANQGTLDRIHKGIHIDHAIDELKMAADAGLEPHIAVMFGYPWEKDEDAIRTLKLVQWLLRKGYAKTAQASVYDVGAYDLSAREYTHQIYHAAFWPDFWWNRIRKIRSTDDIRYIWKGIKSCFGR